MYSGTYFEKYCALHYGGPPPEPALVSVTGDEKAPPLCIVKGCLGPQVEGAIGYCGHHYNSLLNTPGLVTHGDRLAWHTHEEMKVESLLSSQPSVADQAKEEEEKKTPKCQCPGCNRQRVGRYFYCALHYAGPRPANDEKKVVPVCVVDGCSHPVMGTTDSMDLCALHYDKVIKETLLKPEKKKEVMPLCAAPGCFDRQESADCVWCRRHYVRLMMNKDVMPSPSRDKLDDARKTLRQVLDWIETTTTHSTVLINRIESVLHGLLIRLDTDDGEEEEEEDNRFVILSELEQRVQVLEEKVQLIAQTHKHLTAGE